MLTLKFKGFKLQEDQTFNELYVRLNYTANFKFNRGDKLKYSKIMRKILRYLPERFHSKVIAIEERKDINVIRVEELVGPLQTYEVSLPQMKKEKFTVLKTMRENKHYSFDEKYLNDEDLALIARTLKKFLFSKISNEKKI